MKQHVYAVSEVVVVGALLAWLLQRLK